jgi:hypothetical protein
MLIPEFNHHLVLLFLLLIPLLSLVEATGPQHRVDDDEGSEDMKELQTLIHNHHYDEVHHDDHKKHERITHLYMNVVFEHFPKHLHELFKAYPDSKFTVTMRLSGGLFKHFQFKNTIHGRDMLNQQAVRITVPLGKMVFHLTAPQITNFFDSNTVDVTIKQHMIVKEQEVKVKVYAFSKLVHKVNQDREKGDTLTMNYHVNTHTKSESFIH